MSADGLDHVVIHIDDWEASHTLSGGVLAWNADTVEGGDLGSTSAEL